MRIQVGGSMRIFKGKGGTWNIRVNRDGANEFINGIFYLTSFVPEGWSKRASDGKQKANQWLTYVGLAELANKIAKAIVIMKEMHGT